MRAPVDRLQLRLWLCHVPHRHDGRRTSCTASVGPGTLVCTRRLSGTSESEIDLFFGWHEKILLKAMQNHYASKTVQMIMELAKITGWM